MRGFWADVGTWIGNEGNNMAGGEDQAMYADPNATMANPGGATAAGVQNFGNAVGDATAAGVQNLENAVGDLVPHFNWLLYVGAAIIILSVIDSD